MELMSIFEVVRIKQEIKESSEPFEQYAVRSPEDAQKLSASYIADEKVNENSVIVTITENKTDMELKGNRTVVAHKNYKVIDYA